MATALAQFEPPICQEPGCGKLLHEDNNCLICGKGLCYKHHKRCRDATPRERRDIWVATWTSLMSSVLDPLASVPIAEEALALCPSAKTCSVTIPDVADVIGGRYPLWGGRNVNIAVDFDNGVRWLARFPHEGQATPSRAAPRYEMLCELETHRVLKQIAPEFVPEAWLPHTTQYDFYFLENIPGSKVSKLTLPNAIRDIAAFTVKLASVPFSGVGSFHPAQANTSVLDHNQGGTLPSVGPLWRKGSFSAMPYRGPFRTSRDAWLAAIDFRLAQLEAGSIGPRFRRVDAYLAFLDIRYCIATCKEMAMEGPTFITHGDQKQDIIIVKPDGHVAWIDWEFAYTAPLPEAFAFHFLMGHEFYHGSDALSVPEKMLHDEFVALGRTDLAQAVAGCHKYMRLHYLLGSILAHADIVRVLNFTQVWYLRRSFLGELAGPEPKSWSDYEIQASHRHRKVENYRRIRRAERVKMWHDINPFKGCVSA